MSCESSTPRLIGPRMHHDGVFLRVLELRAVRSVGGRVLANARNERALEAFVINAPRAITTSAPSSASRSDVYALPRERLLDGGRNHRRRRGHAHLGAEFAETREDVRARDARVQDVAHDRQRSGRRWPGERAREKGAEHRVLRQVSDLAEEEVPAPGPVGEARHRGEGEDERGPENDRADAGHKLPAPVR